MAITAVALTTGQATNTAAAVTASVSPTAGRPVILAVGAHPAGGPVQPTSSGDAMTVSLMQGSTTIASWAHDPVPAVPTTFAQTLSAPEVSAITDYGNLAALFSAAAAGSAAIFDDGG